MSDLCALKWEKCTLCSTRDLFAHHGSFFALGLVIPGLVMLDGGPFVVTGAIDLTGTKGPAAETSPIPPTTWQ